MHDRVIVLVEDNANDEELTLRAFRKSNILNRVVVVRDGAEALDYFFRRGAYAARPASEVIQVVLLDLKLPKVDGLDVLRSLRADERTRLIPIVILTSSAEDQDLVRGYGLGANSYVRKPVDFNQFVDAVRQLGLYWLVINQAAPV
ncbi:MAG TPA: response regulator [Kofleriaceae bacterium]|jgi:two-component system response regulator|nr:response regulator [Kofleriaceae bacterium]